MLTIAFLIACGDSPPEPAAPEPAATADPHAAATSAEGGKAIERRGKVLETVAADSYTYARLDYCGQEAWVAGPKSELTVGSIVKMPEGTVQTNFESKTLGRTLQYVLFVDWFEATDETEIDCSHLRRPDSEAPAAPADKEEPDLHGKVLETMVSGGYRYVRLDVCGKEVWAAGQANVVKEGHFIQAMEAMPMANFEAKSLGRRFESIFFVNHFDVVPEGPECE